MTDQLRVDLLTELTKATKGRGVPAHTLEEFAGLLDVDRFTDDDGALDTAVVKQFADNTFRVGKPRGGTPPPTRRGGAKKGVAEAKARFGTTRTEQAESRDDAA